MNKYTQIEAYTNKIKGYEERRSRKEKVTIKIPT